MDYFLISCMENNDGKEGSFNDDSKVDELLTENKLRWENTRLSLKSGLSRVHAW